MLEDLTDRQMQQIAREINFSETTFVSGSEPVNGGYDTRIFTPTTELPFAGHPTLGTAFAIQQEIIRQPIERVDLNYQSWTNSSRFQIYLNGDARYLVDAPTAAAIFCIR